MKFLLGLKSPAKVCRHERFVQLPGLATVFAYEVIFQTPARELFSGLYATAECDVLARAKSLLQRVSEQQPGNTSHRKLETLKAITAPVVAEPTPEE